MNDYQRMMKYMSKAKDTTKGRPLGRGTRMKMRVIDNTPVVDVVYHKTVVVRVTPTHTDIDNGGYYTRTTAMRINNFLPTGCSVRRRKGSWYYVNRAGKVYEFAHSMRINNDGQVQTKDGLNLNSI